MLVKKGYKFNAEQNVLCVLAGDKVILKGRHRRNLYVLEGSTICGEAHVTASQEEMALLWHRRLGLMSKKGMDVLRKQDLLSGLKSSKLEFCEHCVFGKHKRSAFGVGIHRSTEVLEYVHSDVWGKSPISSPFGKEYYISFIDDYLRYVWVYFLHHKSKVFATFIKWKAQVETQTGKKIIERGGESSGSDIDKGESHPLGIEGEIIHDINHDTPQGDLLAIAEDVFEPEEHVEEQEGVGRPVGRPPNDDQLESSVRRSSRVKGAPQRYGVWFPSDQVDEHDNEGDIYALITEEGELSSFEKAHNLAEKAEWSTAMRKEMKSLSDNKSWELVELPKGKQVIACRWVYKRKEGSGTGEKIFKARLVAKGFTQRKGVDYSEVFAPVAKYSTIWLLLSLVCMFGFVLDQMDVVIAFLYGLLNEEIFMRQLPSFARKGQESLVCRLLKSLYGLKQSPRQWNKWFDEFMKSQGFTRSVEDPMCT
ncbi:hypothetical protein R1flu_024678 [Riccia fluitans]|uniref:Reverse transcriptase Ty1/copia-type domain-containing protein n=1 Tax=Riccia fluitans TaxID=41844 RepID=A0ABD1XYN3_9MARC